MIDNDLIEIFDDCLNRLSAGETVEQVLRRYAAYEPTLRPLLQTVRLTQRALPEPDEVRLAQMRSRARVLSALNAAPAPRRASPWRGWLAVAALLLVCLGIGAVTFNSLPGDPLYGLKRSVEQGALLLSADRAASLEAARQRRIDEVYLLIALGRETEVTFSGPVEAVEADAVQVAGLDVRLTDTTERPPVLRLGDEVRVDAVTTVNRELVARSIRVTLPAPVERTPEATAEPLTATPTPTATLAPSSTATTTPDPTATPAPTEPPPVSPTAPTRAGATWTPRPSLTPSATPAETRLPSQRTNCQTLRPSGWVTYSARAGDSLAGLATATGTSVSMIRELNCLPESGLIVVGQPLYLPLIPPTNAVPVVPQNPTASGDSDPGDGTPSLVTSGGSNDDSDEDEDNSGPGNNDDDDDDNSGPGSNDDDDDDNSGPGSNDDGDDDSGNDD